MDSTVGGSGDSDVFHSRGQKMVGLAMNQIRLTEGLDEMESTLSENNIEFRENKTAPSNAEKNDISEKNNENESLGTLDRSELLDLDDDSDKDPNYENSTSSSSSSCTTCSSSSSSSEERSSDEPTPTTQSKRKIKRPTKTKKLTRKRQCNKPEWIRNKATMLRNSGQEYISTGYKKRVIPAKNLKEPCAESCTYKCREKIIEDERQKIFSYYYSLPDINRKREFLSLCMEPIAPKYRYVKDEGRSLNNAYYFRVNSEKIRVCKKFVKATLDINDRVLYTVMKKRTEMGTVKLDQRGKHGKHKTVDDEIKNSVREHINSIPRIESHYLRAQSAKEFIEGGKTIAALHRDYTTLRKNNDKPAANYHLYADVFNNEFNISFFVPRKDQCNLCFQFDNGSPEEKENLTEKYENHQNEKVLSRLEKEADKKKSGENFVVICYDMQALLQLPKGDLSIFYYKSKLSVVNFTITDIGRNETRCFVWHEGEAGKGSIEVCSCLLQYLKETAEKYNRDDLEIVLYSDNCGAQQKNRYLIATLLYAVQKYKISTITQKFLVVGHTQNEGDAAHSVIEKEVSRALKSNPLYVPSQYVGIIASAKKTGTPFKVEELCHDDFVDVKELLKVYTGVNYNVNSEGGRVLINDLRIIQIRKDKPFAVFYKTSYSDLEFGQIITTENEPQRNTRNTKNKKNNETAETELPELKCAYPNKLQISDTKKRDLKFLMDNGYIKNVYKDFYYSLLQN